MIKMRDNSDHWYIAWNHYPVMLCAPAADGKSRANSYKEQQVAQETFVWIERGQALQNKYIKKKIKEIVLRVPL